jgi:hypothetical protein
MVSKWVECFNPPLVLRPGETPFTRPIIIGGGKFQSAPGFEARGDGTVIASSSEKSVFQSAPGFEARGDYLGDDNLKVQQTQFTSREVIMFNTEIDPAYQRMLDGIRMKKKGGGYYYPDLIIDRNAIALTKVRYIPTKDEDDVLKQFSGACWIVFV